MSDPFDLLRETLEAQAVAACADAGIANLKLPNFPFQQPKSDPQGPLWAAFHIIAGGSIPAELGDRETAMNKATGIVQFEVYAPEDSGDGPATRAAGAFRKRINRKGLSVPGAGSVTFYASSVRPHPGGAKNGWFCVLAEATYIFHYRES
jgi:hypothetical protein